MPDTNPVKSNLLFKIEMIIFVVLLGGIVFISWQLLSDETKKYLASVPDTIKSSFTKNKSDTPVDNESAPQESFSVPSPSPSPRIITPLPEGKQSYTLSHGNEVKGPRMSKLVIDPLTPGPGIEQTLLLTASHTSKITGAVVEVVTDSGREKHVLKKLSGSDIEGTWEGRWTLKDSYDYTYGFRFVLSSDTGTYDDYMWLRN